MSETKGSLQPLRLKPRELNKYGLIRYPDQAPNPKSDALSFQVVNIHVTDEELLGLSTRSHGPGDEKTVYSLENLTNDAAYKNFAQFQRRINKAKAEAEKADRDAKEEWKRKREQRDGGGYGGGGGGSSYKHRNVASDSGVCDGDDSYVSVPCSSRSSFDVGHDNDNDGGENGGGSFSFFDAASAPSGDNSGGLINRQCHAIVTGVTEEGVNISTIVPFSPDCFVQVPDKWRHEELSGFLTWLTRKFKIREDEVSAEYVLRRQYYGWVPEITCGNDGKETVTGTKKFRYIHLRLPLIKYVRKLKWVFQYGIWINGTKHENLKAWETDIDPVTKFCDRTGMVLHGWCSVMKNGYYYPDTWYTHSTIEVTLKDIDVIAGTPDKTNVAPCMISSGDGEMYCHAHAMSRDDGGYKFPDRTNPKDPMITWSQSFARVGTKDLTRVIYCYKETDCSDPDVSKTNEAALHLAKSPPAGSKHNMESMDEGECKDECKDECDTDIAASASAAAASVVETSTKRHGCEGGEVSMETPDIDLALAVDPDDDDDDDMNKVNVPVIDDLVYAKTLIDNDTQMYNGWTVKTYIECFDSQQEVLDRVRDLNVVYSDADMETGYNIFGFDDIYKNSQKMLGVEYPEHHRFFYQGRLIGMYTPLEKSDFESSAAGVVETHEIDKVGRTTWDMYEYMKRNYKLKKFKLDFVGDQYLGIRKIDMDYEVLFKKFESGPDGRREIAEYCGRDSDIPLLLAFKLNIPMCTMMNCRVYITGSNIVLKGGQQIRVQNQYIIKCHQSGVVMNSDFSMNVKDGYEGATVFDAQRGYYNVPIVVLDFASLYPSVMRFFLFCPSTLVMDNRWKNLPGVVYHVSKTDIGEFWYVQSINGVPIFCVTSDLLDTLLKTRQAKKDAGKKAKQEGRHFDAEVADMEQLAVKGSTNSVYGYHGVKEGKCPCTPVAASTTCEGRHLISQVLRDLLEKRPGTIIIYGDTDSVFIKYVGLDESPESLKKAFQWGGEDAKFCSRNYKGIVNLEQDKVMQPFLCDKKKRYMGLVRKENGTTEFVAKGVEMVRRDRAPFITETQEAASKALLIDGKPKLALDLVQNTLRDLRQGKIPIEKFVISQSLKRDSDYANPEGMPHVVVNRKIMKRKGTEYGYKVGDRVETIVLYEKDPKKQRVADKVEDPAYAKEHNKKPDYLHYLKGFKTSMCALMEPFYEDPEMIYKETEAILHNSNKGLRTLEQSNLFSGSIDFSASFNSRIKRNNNHLSEEEKVMQEAKMVSTTAVGSTSSVRADAVGHVTKPPANLVMMQKTLIPGMSYQEMTDASKKKKATEKRKKDSNKGSRGPDAKKQKMGNISNFLFL